MLPKQNRHNPDIRDLFSGPDNSLISWLHCIYICIILIDSLPCSVNWEELVAKQISRKLSYTSLNPYAVTFFIFLKFPQQRFLPKNKIKQNKAKTTTKEKKYPHKKISKTERSIKFDYSCTIYIYIYIRIPNPSEGAEYDTRSIFKQNLTELNSGFSFF